MATEQEPTFPPFYMTKVTPEQTAAHKLEMLALQPLLQKFRDLGISSIIEEATNAKIPDLAFSDQDGKLTVDFMRTARGSHSSGDIMRGAWSLNPIPKISEDCSYDSTLRIYSSRAHDFVATGP